MRFTTPKGSVRYQLPWSWSAFDYRELCRLLFAQSDARFETAKVDGRGEAAGDGAAATRLTRARERVASGAPLTASLGREAALAPSALQLLQVGESSGRLADMARRAGDLAAQEAERALKTLVTLVEPALIVAFGGLVAFVAAALLQAVYSIRP